MDGGGLVLDFTRFMLISTQFEVVVEVGVELGNFNAVFSPKEPGRWHFHKMCLGT